MSQRSAKMWPALLICTVILFCLIGCEDAHARAGGGGGAGGKGPLIYILLPIALIYVAIVSYFVAKKGREARAILVKASKDPAWNLDELKSRIEYVFFKVQEAWTERDQTIAKNCMSLRLFMKHKLQTDRMLKDGTRNVLEAANLSKVTIVEAADFRDNAKDRLWAYVEGSMIDYTIREDTGAVIKGKTNKPEYFTELWKFVRAEHGWILDEIDQNVEIGTLKRFKSISE